MMRPCSYKWAVLFVAVIAGSQVVNAQEQKPLLLSDAVRTGVQNYQTVLAKRNYLKASQALVKNTKNAYLPDVLAGIQQDYGTVNGMFGPYAPNGVAGVSSSGPLAANQSWNAAFGATYLVNTNWEVYNFGKLSSQIKLSESGVKKDSADLAQEEFVQSIKISGAYLNVLIAQRLIQNAEVNLTRAQMVQTVVLARTRSGLNAGVDSSIANADVSSAKLALIAANDNEQQLRNLLTQLLNNDPNGDYLLDTNFFKTIPSKLNTSFDVAQNPQVQFYKTRIEQSDRAVDALKKSVLPGIELFGIFQTKASGFDYNYSPALSGSYNKDYFTGIDPSRYNYLAGFSLSWNILSIRKVKEQANAQKFISQGLQNEYDLISTQLRDQLVLSDQRMANSLQSYKEVPVQYQAASDAFTQKSVLYKNGLATIIDLQDALFALNKAETDLSVAYINVWQALLLKAASSGDLDLFLGQVR